MNNLWLGGFLGVWIGAALTVGLTMIRERWRGQKEFGIDRDPVWKEPDRFWNPYSE